MLSALLHTEAVILFYMVYFSSLALLFAYLVFYRSLGQRTWIWSILWFWAFWLTLQYVWNELQWFFSSFVTIVFSLLFTAIGVIATVDDGSVAQIFNTQSLRLSKHYYAPLLFVFFALYLFPYRTQNPYVQGPLLSMTRIIILLWLVLIVEFTSPAPAYTSSPMPTHRFYQRFLKCAWVLGVNEWFFFVAFLEMLVLTLSKRSASSEVPVPVPKNAPATASSTGSKRSAAQYGKVAPPPLEPSPPTMVRGFVTPSASSSSRFPGLFNTAPFELHHSENSHRSSQTANLNKNAGNLF